MTSSTLHTNLIHSATPSCPMRTMDKPPDKVLEEIISWKTRCCCVRHPLDTPESILLVEMLSKYAPVDVVHPIEDPTIPLSPYKLTVTCEDPSTLASPRVVEAMMDLSIPIYRGSRNIGDRFNPRSFVCANEPAKSPKTELVEFFRCVVNRVAWLDSHPSDYLRVLRAPWRKHPKP
ncbi:MAG TPA: hypothetical protein VMS77_09430 [Conexivisphaerales archaeon]|nr:hypothetical protein [Conexivisphaerales archaeon]